MSPATSSVLAMVGGRRSRLYFLNYMHGTIGLLRGVSFLGFYVLKVMIVCTIPFMVY